MLVQTGLCRTCLETTLLVFPQGGSFNGYSDVDFRNSAYSVFSSEKMAALKTKFHGTGLVKEVGRLWGQLSDREKSKYRDKLEEVGVRFIF